MLEGFFFMCLSKCTNAGRRIAVVITLFGIDIDVVSTSSSLILKSCKWSYFGTVRACLYRP